MKHTYTNQSCLDAIDVACLHPPARSDTRPFLTFIALRMIPRDENVLMPAPKHIKADGQKQRVPRVSLKLKAIALDMKDDNPCKSAFCACSMQCDQHDSQADICSSTHASELAAWHGVIPQKNIESTSMTTDDTA